MRRPRQDAGRGSSSLELRVASSAVGIPLIILFVWAGARWYTGAIAALLVAATLEFQAARGARLDSLALMGAALSGSLAVAAHAGYNWLVWVMTGVVVLPLLLSMTAYPVQDAFSEWLWTVGGVLYLGWLGCHLVLLRDVGDGRDWVFLALFGTFATDTSAYFVGRAVGRTPLAPAISPGKTVEGAAGGFAFGVGAVLLFNYALGLRVEASDIIPLALLLPLVAQLGDLIESKLKRGMQVKDASSLIPGHGGLMDRFDSVLLVTVVVYYYLKWVIL
ncbi:MAG: phosphatidate cytidylyltransferase [Dehalococcoidia bacterium]|jgi:phosphatidate cytidylyltransferase